MGKQININVRDEYGADLDYNLRWDNCAEELSIEVCTEDVMADRYDEGYDEGAGSRNYEIEDLELEIEKLKGIIEEMENER